MSKETLVAILISAVISFIISYSVAYWFWKKPNSTQFKPRRLIKENEDTEDEVLYKVGFNDTGWQVERIFTNLIDSGEPYKSYANSRSNPNVTTEPTTLEEVKNLNYD